MLNPYTVVFTGRTTSTLLGYAALPWLLLVVLHGVRAVPRLAAAGAAGGGAAAFALVLTSIGGGINGAVVGWMLVGPLRAPGLRAARRRRSAGATRRGFLLRVGVLGMLASLWWIVPAARPRRATASTSCSSPSSRARSGPPTAPPEALRLMAYWTSYVGVGFCGAERAALQRGGDAAVQPVRRGRLAAAARARRGRASSGPGAGATRPFFLLMLLVGVADRGRRLPGRDAEPRRDGVDLPQRPAPALHAHHAEGRAAGGASAWPACSAWPPSWPGRGCARCAAPRCGGSALVGAPARAGGARSRWPPCRSCAAPRSRQQLTWDRIPERLDARPAATSTASCRPTRARIVLPGQIFAYYNWGGTVDSILPAAHRPAGGGALRDAVLRRARVRPARGRSTGSCSSGACCPGQLPPLLG